IITGTMKKGIHVQKAEDALSELFKEVQEQPVTDEEIRVAVKQLTVQMIDSVRTPFGLGQLIGTVQTIFGDPERFADDLTKYLKVKAPDVMRVAQKYLQPNNRAAVILLPNAVPSHESGAPDSVTAPTQDDIPAPLPSASPGLGGQS
ncbi:MAG: hypothetical protein AABZ55_00225, partial [Bdellovibrionota bacterium]